MLVTTDNLMEVLGRYSESSLLAVDTETTGLNVANKVDYLIGICVSDGVTHTYWPFRHAEGNLPRQALHMLWQVLIEKNLIWHNRKFDMHSLTTIGLNPLELKGIQYDTLLLFHLWNEEFFSFELDALAKIYLKDSKSGGDKVHGFGKHVGYAKCPVNVMDEYASKDADLTFRLFKFIWPKIVEQGLDKVYLETEMPFTRLLYKAEQRGVGVNTEFAKEMADIGSSRMATILRKLHFNPSSPKDLNRVLLDELGLPVLAHTKSCKDCAAKKPLDTHEGKASFTKAVMEQYDEILQEMDNPTAKLIAEYRGWQKAVSSLYKPLLEKVGTDGRIRTNFKQHGTVTGRLSASDPNLQQVPRGSDKPWNGRAKSAFTSGRPGYILIGWDYSQLELRLAASYGNESVLIEEFKRPDADPFNVLAPLIFGYLDKKTRHETKTFVYANLYGAGLVKIAMQLGRPVEEVEGLYNNYKNSIPGIMNISKQVATLVEKRGYVKYHDGRRRHIKNKNDSYKAWNSVCQGGGAQLVKKAMLRCEEFEDDNCFIVLQVHDEITFCIKEDMIEEYEPKIIKAMTDFDIGVTLAVDGKEWA